MARGTARKVAGKAAAAAKRVTSGGARRSAATTAPAKKAPAKKSTPAKKAAPATKAAAKKAAPATKAAAKKATPAKKTAAKKTAAKKTVAKKAAPATKAAAKKATPAKKTAAKKTVAKKTAAKKVTAPVKKATPAKKTAAKAAPVKKAAAKKAAPARAPRKLAVKADEKPWTKKELDEVRGELLAERDRLKDELNLAEHELHDLMRDAGDGAGNDQADVGSTTFERDHEMSLANNAREMLAQTQKALTRIEDGTYGVCERCGEPIGKMRLMAFPRATLCLSCKQREERR
ncbi:TraR/DksA family transcriptional regulator [Nocardioides iriomotensis]|uniref:DNA-binding protein n=1 Tax=Nocardioides iriomotensis TaxID=715784 RepID=A0A4Q5J3C5_9ACTN|nr:DNA-binding protein [Nocardioides iriomotensis]